MADSILITDFDGTITERDFFDLILERYIPADGPDFLAEWRAGQRTHFEAMAGYFAYAPETPEALDALMADTRADEALGEAAARLAASGWDLAIVSAGCGWYIERILERAGIKATVYANPGRIEPGRGLVLELPRESPFFSPEVGIDKAAVMVDALGRYRRVAFAGDGRPDLPPALLTPPERRFARGFLAAELTRRGERFRPFNKWSDVVYELTC